MDDLTRSCLGFRLSAVYRRVDRLFNRAYGPLGLPYAHAQILLCLLGAGELHARDLAARTGYDSSTVSRLV
ncbi:MAG: MarR family winged helix-turn-helix transcriptional regulator, partial [Planctomycetota bacterium]